MAAMTRRRALALFVGALVLPLTAAACPSQSEPEDCDADDLAEGDEDCDDLDGGKTKPRSKPKTKSRRK